MTIDDSKAATAGDYVPHTHPITAIKALVWGGIGVLLYVAHSAFVPIALAFLFALILSGPVERLHLRRVPRVVSAALILLVVLTLLGGIVAVTWTPVEDWVSRAPQTMALVKKKVTPIALALNHLDDVRKNAGNFGAPKRVNSAPAQPAPPIESAPAMILDVGGSVIAAALSFVIVTLFLLAGGPPMMARMTAAFVDNLKASYVLNIIGKVREEVSQFYLTTTFINIGLGTATGLAMWAWGMPTPYLWGALAAILNYIPYAGAGTTLVLISLVAVVSFDSSARILGIAGTYIVLAGIEGQIAQPLLVGRRMEVNPLLVFLGLWFGGLFWGIPGIILSTPTLVALKVIAENTKSGKPLTEFLGPNDQNPDRDLRLKKYAGRMA